MDGTSVSWQHRSTIHINKNLNGDEQEMTDTASQREYEYSARDRELWGKLLLYHSGVVVHVYPDFYGILYIPDTGSVVEVQARHAVYHTSIIMQQCGCGQYTHRSLPTREHNDVQHSRRGISH